MPRLNTAAEVWSRLTQFGYMYDSTVAGFVNTTLSSTVGTSGASLTVAAGSTAKDGSYIRIGPNGGASVAQIESGTSVAFTLKSQIGEIHSTGEAVVELRRIDLGPTSDDGVSLEVQSERTTVNFGTQRHAGVHHVAHTDYQCQVGLEALSLENMMVSLGINENRVHGAGSTADPYVADWTPDNIDEVKPLHFWARGALHDGSVVEVQFWDCDFDPAKTMALARGRDAPLGFTFNARHIRILDPADT